MGTFAQLRPIASEDKSRALRSRDVAVQPTSGASRRNTPCRTCSGWQQRAGGCVRGSRDTLRLTREVLRQPRELVFKSSSNCAPDICTSKATVAKRGSLYALGLTPRWVGTCGSRRPTSAGLAGFSRDGRDVVDVRAADAQGPADAVINVGLDAPDARAPEVLPLLQVWRRNRDVGDRILDPIVEPRRAPRDARYRDRR